MRRHLWRLYNLLRSKDEQRTPCSITQITVVSTSCVFTYEGTQELYAQVFRRSFTDLRLSFLISPFTTFQEQWIEAYQGGALANHILMTTGEAHLRPGVVEFDSTLINLYVGLFPEDNGFLTLKPSITHMVSSDALQATREGGGEVLDRFHAIRTIRKSPREQFRTLFSRSEIEVKSLEIPDLFAVHMPPLQPDSVVAGFLVSPSTTRDVADAIYSHAVSNVVYLGNNSLVLRHEDDHRDLGPISRLFRTLRYHRPSEVEDLLKNEGVVLFYVCDAQPIICRDIKTVIHEHTVNSVPYPISSRDPVDFGVPRLALVVGFTTRGLKQVHIDGLQKALDLNPSLYLFGVGGTLPFSDLRVFHFDRLSHALVASCDALLYTGDDNALSQFSAQNKTILIKKNSVHTPTAAAVLDHATTWSVGSELCEAIVSFRRRPPTRVDYLHSPGPVMALFRGIFFG